MPTRPDFFCRFSPSPRHDVQRLASGFETREQAEAYRRGRVGVLREGSRADQRLADKLEACGGPDGRCLSPADPVCARDHRRWVVGETLRLLEGRDDLLAATLVMPRQRVPGGELATLEPRAALAALKRQLERAGLPGLVLVGGLDLSLEVDRRTHGPDAWQPHVHAVTSGCTRQELRGALERHYAATAEVGQPLHVDEVEDRAEQVSYCFKSLHRRRVSGFDAEGQPSTARYRLRDDELREVLRFLDRHGFAELLILKGVRRYGSELRLV
jgi:hypothetical protein